MIIGSIKIKGQVLPLLSRVLKTTNFFERSRGLLFRSPLLINEGLLISNCNSVHTIFMAYPIDLIYLSPDLRITKLVEYLKPYRTSINLEAINVLEVMSGTITRFAFKVGDQLEWTQQS